MKEMEEAKIVELEELLNIDNEHYCFLFRFGKIGMLDITAERYYYYEEYDYNVIKIAQAAIKGQLENAYQWGLKSGRLESKNNDNSESRLTAGIEKRRIPA